MQILVTGATGFIGGHVAAELLLRGHRVRVLVREQSDPGDLVLRGAEVIRGDVLDPAAVQRAVSGCDAVMHLAADFRLWARDESVLIRTNVEGTRLVLGAALASGVERAVYTSTVAMLDPDPCSPEPRPARLEDLGGAYERSKWLAEQAARRLAAEGLPLVIVYPTMPVGPGDHKPTPAGQMIIDLARGHLPFYVDMRLNVAAVEDVAAGHALALERGQPGEGYILGGHNTTLGDLLALLARITGQPAPRVRIPLGLVRIAAAVDEGLIARLSGRPPRVSRASVRIAARCLWVDSSKAARVLGLPQTALETALRGAVHWFRTHGYFSS